ncbi:MAG TPA: phosphoribosylglycinamide formyltransferase [Steroidobacteraceae bacterium]
MSSRPPLRLAVLISGRGSNMVAIARACLEGRIHARVVIVISDQPGAAGLDRARELGIEAVAVPRKAFATQAEFENALIENIDAHNCDVIVLAGFMRILSASFVERYEGRILNIHPALLPKYRGLHTHRRVLEAGDREHGPSVHYVTEELDGGPVVLQAIVDVKPGDTEESLSGRVQAAEHIIFPRVLGWIADGRLAWRDGSVWMDGKPLAAPIVEDMRAAAKT